MWAHGFDDALQACLLCVIAQAVDVSHVWLCTLSGLGVSGVKAVGVLVVTMHAPASPAGLDVTITGDTSTGITYSITFDPLANPGDLPLLRLASAANLTGSNATVAVRSLGNGSLEQWFTPIPVELLQLPVAEPNSVQVRPMGASAVPLQL